MEFLNKGEFSGSLTTEIQLGVNSNNKVILDKNQDGFAFILCDEGNNYGYGDSANIIAEAEYSGTHFINGEESAYGSIYADSGVFEGSATARNFSSTGTAKKVFWNIDNTRSNGGSYKIGSISGASSSTRIKITISGGYGYGSSQNIGSQDTIMLTVANNSAIEGSWFNNGTSGIESVSIKTISAGNTYDVYAEIDTYSEFACEAIVSDGTFIGRDINESPGGSVYTIPKKWSVNQIIESSGDSVGIATNGSIDANSRLHVETLSGSNKIGLRVDGNGSSSYSAICIKANPLAFGTGIEVSIGTSTSTYHRFRYQGTLAGSISYSSSNSVNYNSSSDYRLKENIVEILGASDRVMLLKPCRFNWISDSSKTVDGFIAHEAQEVVPESVSGVKDEIDHKDEPVYQGIDQGKLVPLLTAALQEAISKIASLEERMSRLENRPA